MLTLIYIPLICILLLINVSMSLAVNQTNETKLTFKDLGYSTRRVKVPDDEKERTVRLIVNFPGLEKEGELHILTISMARPLSNIKVYLNDLAIGSSWIEDEIVFPLKDMKENNTLKISVRVKGSGKWVIVKSDSYIQFKLPKKEATLPTQPTIPTPPAIGLEEIRADINEDLNSLDDLLNFASGLNIDTKEEASKVMEFKEKLYTANYEQLMKIEDEIARIKYTTQAKIDGTLKGRLSSLKINVENKKNEIVNSESFLVDIKEASKTIDAAMAYLNKAEKDIEQKEYLSAKKNMDNAVILMENANEKLEKAKSTGYQRGVSLILIQLGGIIVLLLMILLIRRF